MDLAEEITEPASVIELQQPLPSLTLTAPRLASFTPRTDELKGKGGGDHSGDRDSDSDH
jgi:hypothetical protein